MAVECPEAWDLKRVRRAVEGVANDDDLETIVGVSKRHVGYHLQAARVLGWLTRSGRQHEITDGGRSLLQTGAGSPQEHELMRAAVQTCPVVAEVATSLLKGGDLEAVAMQLQKHPKTQLAATTARKRASTLCKWREQVGSASARGAAPAAAVSKVCNRIMVVHLSDIHFNNSERSNPVAARVKKIVAAVLSSVEALAGVDACCVVLSGDIANKGHSDEYSEAEKSLNVLNSELERRLKITPIFFLTPGNHDLDFTNATSIRDKLLASVDPATLDRHYIDECSKPQAAFRDLSSRWHEATPRKIEAIAACETHQLCVGGRTLVFQLLNTAWMSSIHEKQGTLVFPQSTIEELNDRELSAADAVVSAFHHPYNWLEANNGRAFQEAVERTSDIVLTGHEHAPGSYTKERRSGEHNEYLEGGVLQESGSPKQSSFNVLILDLEENQQNTFCYSWSKDLYALEESYPSAPFQRNRYRLRNQFQIRTDFADQLDDPGEPYAHPRKSPLCLSDFFIYPDIQETELYKTSVETDSRVQQAFDFVVEKEQSLVLGGDHTGKTALSKRLFYDLHRRGIVPVLLNAKDLKNTDPAYVHKRIDSAFKQAFGADLHEKYRQLEPESRAIIVDDFHRDPLNLTGKDALAKVLTEFAGTVVLLAGEEFELQALTVLPKTAELWKFSHGRILELGHVKRYELVRKWCWLGSRANTTSEDLSREVQRKDATVTGLVVANLAPSIPGVLLLCLQNMELQKKLASDAGSFGHLYEALLTHNLHQAASSVEPIDLDAKQKFLSEIAHSIFSQDEESLGNAAFERCFDEYKEQFHVPYAFSKMKRELLDSRLIFERQGRMGFRYPGAYYFFVARFLRDRLEEQSTRTEVERLTTHIHAEEAANILLFLCYLSKETFIIDTLLNTARALFPKADGSDFGAALKPLAAPKNLPLELDDGDHEDHRRKQREARDKLERVSILDDVEDPLPAELTQLTAAFRTVQLLGQILRGFPGSIDGQRKMEVTEECYSLGTRSAQSLLAIFMDDREPLLELLTEVVGLRRPKLRKDPEKLQDAARRLLFGVCEGFCFASIIQVSEAVGNRVLSRTYEEVLKKNDCVNYRLIDIAIRLDHFDSFPATKLDKLHKDLHSSLMPHSLLRHLVWRHLYIFHVPYTVRDSVCSKLDIKQVPRLKAPGKK